jgi:casein kinase 1/casein kinase I family protein HRR25
MRLAQSARDDVESLGYVLLFLLRGRLPWQGLKANSEEEKDSMILELKQPAKGLFDDVPEEFSRYFQHIRSSDRKLDYAYLRRLFHGLFRRKGWKTDHVFDWTVLKFLEEMENSKSAQ